MRVVSVVVEIAAPGLTKIPVSDQVGFLSSRCTAQRDRRIRLFQKIGPGASGLIVTMPRADGYWSADRPSRSIGGRPGVGAGEPASGIGAHHMKRRRRESIGAGAENELYEPAVWSLGLRALGSAVISAIRRYVIMLRKFAAAVVDALWLDCGLSWRPASPARGSRACRVGVLTCNVASGFGLFFRLVPGGQLHIRALGGLRLRNIMSAR